MIHTAPDDPHEECLHLPRAAVQFPIRLRPPPGFLPDDPATWPSIEGRLEYVDGRIQYMPPCGSVQQEVCVDAVTVLSLWARARGEFVVGGNEAGMLLGGEVRAADAAVWRRSDAGPASHELRRNPPVLAVEVAGQEEREAELRDKARWYLEAGVEVVWLVLPDSREVLVVTPGGERRCRAPERLPPHPALPDLEPSVAEFFMQIDRVGR